MIKNITPREQELEREVAALRASLNQWLNKTEWVQKTATTKELGMHIADVLKDRVDTLKKRIDNDEQSLYRLHYLMKDNGWHPGSTDDDLIDILAQKINELKAERDVLKEEIEALRNQEPFVYAVVCPPNKYCGYPEIVHSEGYKKGCHKHIHDAIAEGVSSAKTWIVRKLYLAAGAKEKE